jgi:hypothetical protein
MKRCISIGLLLAATSAWGQAPVERPGTQPLCTPFVGHATNLLSFVERAERTGSVDSSHVAARRVADVALKCAEAETRLLSRADADAQLALVQRRFDIGTATSAQLGAARVAVQKASYCEAAFSWITQMTEHYQRRSEVGLVGPEALPPILAELEAIAPVCGMSRI